MLEKGTSHWLHIPGMEMLMCPATHTVPLHSLRHAPGCVWQVRLPSTGARLLLASDGLWDAVMTSRLIASMRRYPLPEAAAVQAVRMAKQSSGGILRDDITVMVVDFLPRGSDTFEHVMLAAQAAQLAPQRGLGSFVRSMVQRGGGQRGDVSPERKAPSAGNPVMRLIHKFESMGRGTGREGDAAAAPAGKKRSGFMGLGRRSSAAGDDAAGRTAEAGDPSSTPTRGARVWKRTGHLSQGTEKPATCTAQHSTAQHSTGHAPNTIRLPPAPLHSTAHAPNTIRLLPPPLQSRGTVCSVGSGLQAASARRPAPPPTPRFMAPLTSVPASVAAAIPHSHRCACAGVGGWVGGLAGVLMVLFDPLHCPASPVPDHALMLAWQCTHATLILLFPPHVFCLNLPTCTPHPTLTHLQVIADVDSWVEMGTIISAAATLAQQAHDEAMEVASAKRRAEEAAVVESDAPPVAATAAAVVAAVQAGEAEAEAAAAAAAAAAPTEAYLTHAAGAAGAVVQEKKRPAPLTEEELLELSTPDGVDVHAPALVPKVALLAAAEKAAEIGAPPAEVEVQHIPLPPKVEHPGKMDDNAETMGTQANGRVGVVMEVQEVVRVAMEAQERVAVAMKAQERVSVALDVQQERVGVGMVVQQRMSLSLNPRQHVAVAMEPLRHVVVASAVPQLAPEEVDAPVPPALVELQSSSGGQGAPAVGLGLMSGHTAPLDVPRRPPRKFDDRPSVERLLERHAAKTELVEGEWRGVRGGGGPWWRSHEAVSVGPLLQLAACAQTCVPSEFVQPAWCGCCRKVPGMRLSQ
jgi:hypothetical protein